MKAKIIFTCFSFDQVSFGSCAPPMISFDDCLQSQWSEAKAQPSPVSCIVILLISPKAAPWSPVQPRRWSVCCWWEDDCVRAGMSLQKSVLPTFCQPSIFFLHLFVFPPFFSIFFIEHEVMLERLTVKLMSPHL